MYRSILLASAVAFCVAGAAAAQPQSDGPWTGPYVGLNFGYGGGGFNYPFSGTTTPTGTTRTAGELKQNSNGVLGGFQVGYNYELPNGVVAGVVTDFDGASITGGNELTDYGRAGGPSNGSLSSNVDYFGTVRGVLGYSLFGGRVLPYVTGGFAYARMTTANGFSCAACGVGGGVVTASSYSATDTGWTLGAGFDYPINDKLSLRTEYLYADFGRNTTPQTAIYGGSGALAYNATTGVSTTLNVLRVGLNYRF